MIVYQSEQVGWPWALCTLLSTSCLESAMPSADQEMLQIVQIFKKLRNLVKFYFSQINIFSAFKSTWSLSSGQQCHQEMLHIVWIFRKLHNMVKLYFSQINVFSPFMEHMVTFLGSAMSSGSATNCLDFYGTTYYSWFVVPKKILLQN